MRILVIGSGGREHALVWKLKQSPRVSEVFVAPGNGGTAREGAINVAVDAGDLDGLVELARKEKIDLVVPGPELPLTKGITDRMREAGIPCFGPDAYCACLEGSKAFAKDVMNRAGVPTAHSQVFTDPDKAKNAVVKLGAPLVVKADGLAAGKGVVVAKTTQEALDAVDDIMCKRAHGAAGAKLVIEEFLVGEEASFLCLCDGKTAVPLPSAQDHKAAYDGDQGPNTGGMGAYSPAPILPYNEAEAMADTVIRPILAALAKDGHPFVGVLYAGLMMTADGPKVLEYNTRFGDPECQPLLMRLEGDLVQIMLDCIEGMQSEEGRTLVLSVLNQGSLPFLADDDVVEVTCNVSKNGIAPVKQETVPTMCELYIRLIKRYERLTVEAVREGSEEKAVEALMTHPLINSYSLAKKLIADYNEVYGEKILKGNA